jgi:plasmid stabilization system protein ParE
MNFKLRWTSEAEKTFGQNLEYLSKEWSNAATNDFIDRVEEVLEKIKANPKLYPLRTIGKRS